MNKVVYGLVVLIVVLVSVGLLVSKLEDGAAEAPVVHGAEITDVIDESATLELRERVPIDEGLSGMLLKYCDTEARRFVYVITTGGVSVSNATCD